MVDGKVAEFEYEVPKPVKDIPEVYGIPKESDPSIDKQRKSLSSLRRTWSGL